MSRAAATTPSRRVQMLAALLALGGLSCFAYTGSVSAADLQDNLPLFHPAAADINQLAESVSRHSWSPHWCMQMSIP